MGIVRQQTERIEELEVECVQAEKGLTKLEAELKKEVDACEGLKLKKEELTSALTEALEKIEHLELKLKETNETLKGEVEAKEAEIERLEEKIEGLEKQLGEARKDVEGLGKEKAFIVEQSASTQAKAMHELLALQEKCAEVSYELGKASKEREASLGVVGEKEACVSQLRAEKKELETEIRREKREKTEAIEKVLALETVAAKVC